MTYPGGGPGGYPGQGPQQPPQGPGYGHQPPQGNPLAGMNLPVLLALGVTLLGVVAYFCGFSDEASPVEFQVQLMLLAGLLAAFRALPNGPKYFPVAAVLAVLAALSMLDAMIGIPDSVGTPGIAVVLLIISILQMAAAVVALLFDLGMMKPPAPRQQPQPPQHGQYGPPPGQQPFTGPGYGQPGQQTTFQPQQGHFGQPGTPPGGYPQQG